MFAPSVWNKSTKAALLFVEYLLFTTALSQWKK